MTIRGRKLGGRRWLWSVFCAALSIAAAGTVAGQTSPFFPGGEAGAADGEEGKQPAETAKEAQDRIDRLDPSAATPEALASLAEALNARAVELERQREALQGEEKRLADVRAAVEARVQELLAVRTTVDERIDAFKAELATRREEQVTKLVKAMSGMPPESAAGVAAEMDEGLVVRVFDRMKGRTTGAILAELPPGKAAKVGQRLALYRAGTPACPGQEL